MANKTKVAILVSGRGSNMRAIVEASKSSDYPAKVALIISNKEDAPALEYAKENNISSIVISHKAYKTREEFDRKVSEAIGESGCELVCLAGFMRVLSPYFVKKWQGKLINIHPSLLPAFKGANGVKDALEYGVKYSGCTVHFVSQEVDCGKIIDQAVVEVRENDTIDTLGSRILEKEHILYARALKKVIEGNF